MAFYSGSWKRCVNRNIIGCDQDLARMACAQAHILLPMSQGRDRLMNLFMTLPRNLKAAHFEACECGDSPLLATSLSLPNPNIGRLRPTSFRNCSLSFKPEGRRHASWSPSVNATVESVALHTKCATMLKKRPYLKYNGKNILYSNDFSIRPVHESIVH